MRQGRLRDKIDFVKLFVNSKLFKKVKEEVVISDDNIGKLLKLIKTVGFEVHEPRGKDIFIYKKPISDELYYLIWIDYEGIYDSIDFAMYIKENEKHETIKDFLNDFHFYNVKSDKDFKKILEIVNSEFKNIIRQNKIEKLIE